MAGFLYFSPSRELPEGLQYAFDRKPIEREVGNGPGGEPGYIFGDSQAFSDNPAQVGFYPDRQTWIIQPNLKSAFVGLFTEAPKPTEEELRREKQLPGNYITMDDGSQWLIPIARSWNSRGDYTVELPQAIGVNQEGELISGDIVRKYRGLWEAAQRLYDGLFQPIIDEDEDAKSVVKYEDVFEVISSNYRVKQTELGMLGIMTTDLFIDIAKIVIDLDSFMKLKKKEVVDSSSTSDGLQDLTLATIPQ